MNFAYSSSCVFTDSSTRACIVTDFGCFGGALMIAMGSFYSSSPTRCFARGQSECLSVCNVLLFGHLRKDRGDAKGDLHGDLGLLRSSHRATLGEH